MKQSVKVDIFGNDYILKADTDDRHIQKVADLVDQKMKEVSLSTNSKNTTNIAILAALNIADEYLKIKDEKDKAETRVRELAQLIDASL